MKKEVKPTRFFDLSSREKKKIVVGAVRDANREQKELVQKYEKMFGELKTSH